MPNYIDIMDDIDTLDFEGVEYLSPCGKREIELEYLNRTYNGKALAFAVTYYNS